MMRRGCAGHLPRSLIGMESTATKGGETRSPLGVHVQRYWETIYVLAECNLKLRYRGSLLGVYWSLLNPLIMTGLYAAIFGSAFAPQYSNSVVSYILATFTGLVVINFFSAATTQALVSIVNNGPLLNKVPIPTSVFPVAEVTANIFQLLVGSLPLLAIATVIHTHSVMRLGLLVFPLLSLVLISLGASLLVSGLFIFFRDLPYFYELVLAMLLIGSPIFYPEAIVPETVRPLLSLNPLWPTIQSLRQIVVPSGDSADLTLLILDALLRGLVMVALGWAFFTSWRSQFMDLL